MFKFGATKAVVTAGKIMCDMGVQGYDQKTITEFLNRFEQAMTGVKLGRPIK